MAQRSPVPSVSRRSLLFSAAAALLPQAGKATPHDLARRHRTAVEHSLEVPRGEALTYGRLAETTLIDHPDPLNEPQYLLEGKTAEVFTPYDLARRYCAAVEHSLEVPRGEALIYGWLAETTLLGHPDPLNEPQYLLVVDSCPTVQVAFLYWRLLPGHYELVGASPASTGDAKRTGCVATPCGLFGQANAAGGAGSLASRVYDFGIHRARMPGRGFTPLHLQAHAAQGPSRARLGTAQSDGRVLLPASLVAFLDTHGVLDGARGAANSAAGTALVPFAGRYMVVVDSERDDRPEWTATA